MIDNKYSDQTRMCDYTHNPRETGIEGSGTRFPAHAGKYTSQNKDKEKMEPYRMLSNQYRAVDFCIPIGLKFITPMQGNRTGGQIEILYAFESCVPHQVLQFFLRGVYTDRFGEVAIAILVFGNKFSHCRQHLE